METRGKEEERGREQSFSSHLSDLRTPEYHLVGSQDAIHRIAFSMR
jgi:hypothetical protein